MKYTIQYIPLSLIKPALSIKMTEHILKLRRVMWDCMDLLIVRKNKKDGTYTILSGQCRYDFFRKHTNKQYAPCIVDEDKPQKGIRSIFHRSLIRRLRQEFPGILERLTPPGLSIVRIFLKQEPRFETLSLMQKIKVLLPAVRYKKTVVTSMKGKVDEYCRR